MYMKVQFPQLEMNFGNLFFKSIRSVNGSARLCRLVTVWCITAYSASLCNVSRITDSDSIPTKFGSNGGQYLSKNFVADAVDIASPSVVNIQCKAALGIEAGSGFIVSSEGFIVTNAHVVKRAFKKGSSVQVTMWDGTKVAAVVHSLDEKTDIALVKMNTSGRENSIPVAKLGRSSQLRAGEFVVALGSPLMLKNTVTFGIVSSAGRSGRELNIHQSRIDYIQTDAAVNMGNSGGPLVNVSGEVIGINTMKHKEGGVSFAIPIDTAMKVVDVLMQYKRIEHPYVGMRIANYTPSTNSFNSNSFWKRNREMELPLDSKHVVVITDVEDGSPASIASLQRGDVLLEINGVVIRDVRQVLDEIGFQINRRLTLKVQRNGEILDAVLVTSARS